MAKIDCDNIDKLQLVWSEQSCWITTSKCMGSKCMSKLSSWANFEDEWVILSYYHKQANVWIIQI